MKKQPWLRRALILVVIVLIVAGAFALIKRKKKAMAEAPKYGVRPMPVWAVRAESGSLAQHINYLAVVEALQSAKVSARVTATVTRLHCDEGVRVEAGQILLTLDTQELRDNLASVEAEIAKARADLSANEATVVSLRETAAYAQREAERDRTLLDQNDIPASVAEGSADKARQAQARLEAGQHQSEALGQLVKALNKKRDSFQTRLDYGTIRSPYAGMVTQRLVDLGDLAAPGKVLLVVEDRTELKLSFDVPQADMAQVHEGVDVVFELGTETRRATLSHLFPTLDKARMQRAEVFVSQDQGAGLTPGQTLSLAVTLAPVENTVIVPASALVPGPQRLQHVFVVAGSTLVPHPVTVLASQGDRVAIQGIEPDQLVVTSTFLGWTRLSAGQKVEVLQ
jgi:RND family efflux transporter MFP subunit